MGQRLKEKSYIDKIINYAENILLTGDDILRITDKKTKIMLYEDLKNYTDIEEVIKPYNAVVLAYENKNRLGGHWVLVMKNKYDDGDDIIEFFDSYGFYPDDEEKLNIYNTQPYLSMLLNKVAGKYKIIYNNYKLQHKLSDVNTCGRHISVRLRFREYPLKSYIDLITTAKYNPDELVTLLTLLV